MVGQRPRPGNFGKVDYIYMACTCTATAPAGVPFTVDGTQYYVVAGSYTVAALLAAITSGPNFISGAVNGFRNTVTNAAIQGSAATQTINGGEALVSLYGPF